MASSAGASIDLTLSSDDEFNPLDSIIQPSNHRPRTMPVGLHVSVPQPPPKATPPPTNRIAYVPTMQNKSGRPNLSSSTSETRPTHEIMREIRPSLSNNLATVDRMPTSNNYISVFHAPTSGEENDEFKSSQPEKRRKLSIPTTTPGPIKSLDPVHRSDASRQKKDHVDGRQALPASYPAGLSQPASAPYSNSTAKPNTIGRPSVQSLNMVLKRNGATESLPEEKVASDGCRELHFERSTDMPPASDATIHASEGSPIELNATNGKAVDQYHHLSPGLGVLSKPPIPEDALSVESPAISEKDHPMTESPVDAHVEDEVYLELLSQAPAHDKIALLLQTTSRGQAMASSIPKNFHRTHLNPSKRISRPHARATRYSLMDERDSVFSNSDVPSTSASMSDNNFKLHPPAERTAVTTIEPSTRRDWTGRLTEAEAHLLIFLKEVKQLKWAEITVKFQKHYPHRQYHVLQTSYSAKINRRDRSQDPPMLILPSCYASEARINWAKIYATPGRLYDRDRHRRREADVITERSQHQPQINSRSTWPNAVESLQDQSSGAESSGYLRRPRRAVPVKNYTWPKKRALTVEDSSDDLAEKSFVQYQISEDHTPAPEQAIDVDNDPIDVDFDPDDATIALTAQNQHSASNVQLLPYLSFSQRSILQNVPRGFEWDQLVSRDWQGSLIHVDFSPTELDLVEGTIMRLDFHPPMELPQPLKYRSQRKRLQRLLYGLTESTLLRLSNRLRPKLLRDRRSVEAFLRDAQDDNIRFTSPRVERLASARPNKSFSSDAKLSASSMIRQREIGLRSHRGWSSATRPISYALKNKVQDSLGPVCSYTGASSDVHAVAWSIDGQCFAAGAICVDDPHSMQYNRSNNLLYGDVSRNTINELGKHYIMRPKPKSGPNSTHAMYASQDPRLYKTVTSVAFSPNGRFMFSGGWDQNAVMWETKHDGSQPTEMISLHHKAEVRIMTVNSSGVLATATKKHIGNAVKVMHISEEDPLRAPVTSNFRSSKAAERPDMSILPTALHFSPRYNNLLLGGFGAHVRQDGRDMSGDICLWDINGNHAFNIWGSGKMVFDLSFHSRHRWFAVGTVASATANRGTRSTVRLFDEQNGASYGKFSLFAELECPALDINDVVWCPGDDFLVAAGCTSGRAYVWDVRNPNRFLRELSHGNSSMPLDDENDRELTDTGVRFLSWGENATRLYTGSSDGVVKVWNVLGSEEETFVKDVITFNSGIMSGAFSPDRSRLLVGEVNGSVSVLEVGRDDCSPKETDRMQYIPYMSKDNDVLSSIPTAEADCGISSAKELLETGQMMMMPMGGLPIRQAVQGPKYVGPFDSSVDAPFLREQALEMQLKMAKTPASHCEVCSGQDSSHVGKITSEGSGDSGRSMDRIPDELRVQWESRPAKVLLPGKVPCSLCGRAARPSDKDDQLDGTRSQPRCERCAFSCLRCGHSPGLETLLPWSTKCVDSSTETLTCHECHLTWTVGVLGYELVGDGYNKACQIRNHIPELTGYGKALALARMDAKWPLGNDKASYGDEMNALTDYYLSLAIDGPESPPL